MTTKKRSAVFRPSIRDPHSYVHAVLTVMHYVYMSSLLQIRNVPDEARRTLKARAAARGESLNAYMLELIARETERTTVG
ncbi:hypothetical protein DFQ14_11384 [Halopolyspora algeriensis]|uniref:Antitoxin FitA-like ribbon-helix-helix domain-containing protein n=1 Tax=Halopolyspora algeriensis TaxID=1500506 RepID=A0A368VFF0_9ACTN|nr:hypothetical protein DFQ14_11384 [Halopolyspora algeriensis]TQM46561.1 hypothetical protein FHU43_3676 [Halopolyspora algeriensis]